MRSQRVRHDSATKQKHNCIYSGSLNNGFEQSRSNYMCIFSINIYSAFLICGFCIHRLNQTIRIFTCDRINRWCETHRVGRLTTLGVFSIHRFWYPPWLLEPIPQKYQGTNCMCTYNAGIKTLSWDWKQRQGRQAFWMIFYPGNIYAFGGLAC